MMTSPMDRMGPPTLASLAGRWQTPIREDEFALPTLHNFLGTAQACWGPSGIQNWIFPPTGLPTAIGRLYEFGEDGRPLSVDPRGTSYQWSPWEILRQHDRVSTSMRLHWADAAVSENLEFRQGGRYALVFGGLCRTWRFTDYWNLPPEDVPQLSVSWTGDQVAIGDCKTFGLALVTPTVRPAAVATYLSLDDFHAGRPTDGPGRLVALEFDVEAGQHIGWTGVQGTDEHPVAKGSADDVHERWSDLWESVFTPNNQHFSGHLPTLNIPDERLERLYYHGILALLSARKTFPASNPRAALATGGQAIWTVEGDEHVPVGYTTGASDGAATVSFLWELMMEAPMLSLLDPVALRDQLNRFLLADMSQHWGIDLLTGQGVGMWYGINDGAVVSAAADYLRITGDLDWLDRTVGEVSVREHLLRHVRRHDELSGGGDLADYGGAENVLECVSSYEHQVASLNAVAAWSHRFAAEVLDPTQSETLLTRADAIETAVLSLMEPDGTFACVTPEGRRTVRTCLDFLYVGRYMAHALDDQQRAVMVRTFTEEFETSDWMVALSPRDPDSLTTKLPSFQTFRADHQSTGSYDGWPGLVAGVRFAFGDDEATLDWLSRMSETTWEGPFGQAHWVGISDADRAQRPATKASFFNGNCYLEACGVTFSTTLLEHFAPHELRLETPMTQP